jgi:hypothetical protein
MGEDLRRRVLCSARLRARFNVLVLCVAYVLRRSCKISWNHAFARDNGYRVLRFWSHQVMENTDEALAEIDKFLSFDSSES